jgi:hypothetical protein
MSATDTTGPLPVIPIPVPASPGVHLAMTEVVFDTDAGPLTVYQCACGRMFDAPRLVRHIAGRGAA